MAWIGNARLGWSGSMCEQCPSGLVLPGDEPLPLREVIPGLYVADNAYQRDAGYFAPSPLYRRRLLGDPLRSVTSGTVEQNVERLRLEFRSL